MFYRLEPIISPYLQELNNVSNQDPSPHAKPKVDFVFKLLTMLIQSLEPPQNDEQQNNAPAKPNLPVQVLFPQIYPIIKRVAEKWYRDSDVIECMCNLLNQCVQTLQVRTVDGVLIGVITHNVWLPLFTGQYPAVRRRPRDAADAVLRGGAPQLCARLGEEFLRAVRQRRVAPTKNAAVFQAFDRADDAGNDAVVKPL